MSVTKSVYKLRSWMLNWGIYCKMHTAEIYISYPIMDLWRDSFILIPQWTHPCIHYYIQQHIRICGFSRTGLIALLFNLFLSYRKVPNYTFYFHTFYQNNVFESFLPYHAISPIELKLPPNRVIILQLLLVWVIILCLQTSRNASQLCQYPVL